MIIICWTIWIDTQYLPVCFTQMGFSYAQNEEVVIRMASRIQGITVEIGGDTTKLSKALEGVTKTIKGTQSSLKDVNKLLKLDPSNPELVVRKQKMLKDAIELKKRGDDQQNIAGKFTEDRLINGWLYGNMKIQ